MSEINQFPAKGTVYDDYSICTSATRPTSPVVGQMIYETDTQLTLQYYGTGWGPIWNLPWGQVGYAARTTDYAGWSTVSTVSALSVSVTFVANRRYRISAFARLYGSVAANLSMAIYDGTSQICQSAIYAGSGGGDVTLTPWLEFVPGATTKTFQLQVTAGAGTGTVYASSGRPAQILVEDLGPVMATMGGLAYPSNTNATNYQIVTSSTRPSVPYAGQKIYETDTRKTLVYDSTLAGWYPPWNLPWGQVVSAAVTSNIALATGGPWDMPGVVIPSVPVVNGRRYRVSANLWVTSGVAQVVSTDIYTNVTRLSITRTYLSTGGADASPSVVALWTPSFTGNLPVNVRYTVSTGIATIGAGSTYPANLIVEDIGPA